MLQEKIDKSVRYAKTIKIPTYVFSILFALGVPIAAYAFDWAVDVSKKVLIHEKTIETNENKFNMELEFMKEKEINKNKQLDRMSDDLRTIRKYIMEQH